MSEQVEGAVNPGQAIYDALSAEAKAAVDALPDDVFSGEGGLDAARRFAESVKLADAINPEGWLINPDSRTGGRDILSLIVSGTRLIHVRYRQFLVVRYDDDVLDESTREWISDRQFKTEAILKTWPNLHRVHIPFPDVAESPAGLWTAHEAAARVLNHPDWVYGRGSGGDWHKDMWRIKLGVITDQALSAPSYMPPDRYGLTGIGEPDSTSNLGHVIYDALRDEGVDSTSPTGKRYWKISAGRGSRDWPLFRDESIIAISWYDELFDPTELSADHDEFLDALMSHTTVSHQGAESVWEFLNVVSVGDEVLVYSRYQVIASGYVTGEYRYEAGVPDYRHRRSAAWTVLESHPTDSVSASLQQKLSQQQTLVELTPAEFAEAVGRSVDATAGDEATQPSKAIGAMLTSEFASAGLTYTDYEVASFYTALQTKGFAILSGISGTGKSKIAQRFASILPSAVILPEVSNPDAASGVYLRLRPYMQRYNRFAIPMKYQERLPVPEPGGTWEVPIEINGQFGDCRVHTSDGTNSNNTWVYLKGESVELFRRIDEQMFVVDFMPDEAGRVSKVVLNSGTGTVASEPAIRSSARNHLFLPVRPDWRDGKALIGYHNPLSSEYVRTDFLEFVLAAADDFRAGYRNAFFVILDEMNLAHVEYYFADVLSVIESGRDEDGWTVEGIPLAVGDEDADLPETLKLPPNLYIVGTVNMDETTHPFSPKVLDRAFTIELTEVDFNDYPKESTGSAEADEAAKRALLDAFTRQGRYPRIDKREIAELVDRFPRFRADLQSLNTSLRRSRMHFGYRVFDEIMQFVYNAELNGMFTTDEAFDHAVLMKVLPKFNGSRGKLQTALFELLHWCRTSGTLEPGARADLEARFSQLIDKGQPFDSVVTDGADTVEDNWRYPATGRRAALMMQDLYTDGFASFG